MHFTLALTPLLYQIIPQIVAVVVEALDGVKRAGRKLDKKSLKKYLVWKLTIIIARFRIKRKKKIVQVLANFIMLELFSNE